MGCCSSRAAPSAPFWVLGLSQALWSGSSTTGGRNIPDTNGGIAGASQFGLFALGGFLALLFTVLTTSLTNHRIGAGYDHENVTDTTDGLPSLRETTFVQALFNNLSALWKLCRRLTQRYSSG